MRDVARVLGFAVGVVVLGCGGAPSAGSELCGTEAVNLCTSDQAVKTEFREVDAAAVLAKVVDLPISSWRFKMDRPEVRHIGPTAQDFYASFGLGNSDKLLIPLDGNGVALASVQALYARVVAAETENQQLRGRLDALEQRLAALEVPEQPATR